LGGSSTKTRRRERHAAELPCHQPSGRRRPWRQQECVPASNRRPAAAPLWADRADFCPLSITANALPENAFALIDSRLGFEDTVEQYHADLTALLLPIIKPLNLTFNAFGDRVFTPEVMSLGNVTLSGEGRNPPPITTSDGKTWAFMASLVRGVFGEETLVTPKAMLGATDGSKMVRPLRS
jgi:hypothetical protein